MWLLLLLLRTGGQSLLADRSQGWLHSGPCLPSCGKGFRVLLQLRCLQSPTYSPGRLAGCLEASVRPSNAGESSGSSEAVGELQLLRASHMGLLINTALPSRILPYGLWSAVTRPEQPASVQLLLGMMLCDEGP